MQEAAEPVVLADAPRRVYLLTSLRMALENYAYLPDKPCVSQESNDSLLQRIRRLRADDPHCLIILSLHWGGEHTLEPVSLQRHEAHQLILAGADILICHHTHTLQTIETFRNKQIYYSIGNFIFDQQKALNRNACIVRLQITDNDLKTETIPIEIRQCTPYIADSYRKK